MDAEAGEVVILAALVNDAHIQGGGLVDQLLDGIQLVIVQQGHGGALEGHEGNQPFKPAAVQHPQDLGTGGQVFLVHLGAAFPIPAVDIGEVDIFPPVVGVIEELALAHGAAGHIDVLPVQAEHILAAEFFSGSGDRLKNEAAGLKVGNHGGAEEAGFRAVQNPQGFLVAEGALCQLRGADGVVKYGNGAAAEGRHLGDYFHFFFIEGNFHNSHSFSCAAVFRPAAFLAGFIVASEGAKRYGPRVHCFSGGRIDFCSKSTKPHNVRQKELVKITK